MQGTSESSIDIRIDGSSGFNVWLPHITSYVPALESIETVNVVTNSFDAEQGLAGGGAINVQIKSGTNDLRGSAFAYNSNNALMATPFFTPDGERNPKYINNQFGATLGGADQVRLPGPELAAAIWRRHLGRRELHFLENDGG